MRRRALVSLIAAGVALAGCSPLGCEVSQDKLAQLKLGMSRDEASSLLGCPGKQVSQNGSFATVEWSGPQTLSLSRFYVVFLDGRVYTTATEKRGGF